MRSTLPLLILLAASACSGHASKQDKLDEAAKQSTPEAAQVLNGAAENGMNADDAVNAAAAAQAGNTSASGNSGSNAE